MAEELVKACINVLDLKANSKKRIRLEFQDKLDNLNLLVVELRERLKNTFEIFHNIRIDISPKIKNTFEVQPLRWKVERTLSWLQSSRRLSKDYEIKAVYAETMCIISHFHTLLRRF